MSYFIEAEAKLRKGIPEAEKGGQKEKVIAKPTAEALVEFCRQNDEFAQAVVQGGNFSDCVKSVCKGMGNAVSDIEVYRKAVEFYFPGAKVEFKMEIRMSEFDTKADNVISINFMDLL